MKHISLSLLTIGLLLFSSCFEDDKRLISADDVNAVPLHFYANIEAGQDSSLQTKSTLSGTSTDATRKVLWEPSDSIYVTNGTNGAKFNNITPEKSDVADFSGKLSLGTNYYAAFPYGIVSGFEASTFHLTLPTVQTYKADGIGSESFPMVAQCINNVFEFKNLCGILVLNLKGSAVIDSIRFSGTDDAEKPIIVSGAASVSTTYTDAPSLEMDSTAVDYVILNCIGSTGKGVNLDSNKPTPFHIVLPASTYAHFSVVIYSSEGKHMTINSEKPLTIKRSKRTTTSSKEYEADKPVYEYVDLGLSVNWATINVGAEKAGEKGVYYAWGEIETKEVWNWKTYKHATSDYYENNVIFTKYVTQSDAGKIDNKSTLELEDDVAHVKWGGNWRIPTMEEMNELIDNCTFTWTTVDGVNGLRVTSNIEGYTDQSIFLPAAGSHIRGGLSGVGGYCEYWTSSLWTINSSLAYNFRYSNYESKLSVNCYSRYEGLTIRPVCPKDEHFNNATITLNYDTISIEVGATDTLVATIKQGNEVIDRVITWTTADSSIAIVNESGLVTGISVGTTKITAIGFGKSAVCDITVKPKAPEYVNLGLSVNWATFNIGANKPEDTGTFYAWGETTTKDSYSWDNYSLSQGTRTSMTKYCFDASAGYNGFTDSKTVLDPEDDIAHIKWGNNWRIPTKEEYEELINNCTWQWTSINGIYGYKISGKVAGYVNNFIFLPAIYSGGYTESRTGLYWSSTLSSNNSNQAYRLQFIETQYHETFDYERYLAYAIRPVTPSTSWLSNLNITLNEEAVTLHRNETVHLEANVKKGNEEMSYPIIWSSDKPAVATVNESGLVTAISTGTAIITATFQNKSVTCIVTVKDYEYVDLGLSVNWATFNVGANKPEDYGNYFAWGETETKSSYTWSQYKFHTGGEKIGDKNDNVTFSKYSYNSFYGVVDNILILESEDDVASVKWGGNWRLPTKEEQDELRNKCTWTWTIVNGVYGYRISSNITGYTDRSIFLPAAGYYYGNYNETTFTSAGVKGYYWSSSLATGVPCYGSCIRISSDTHDWSEEKRSNGVSARPVCTSESWLNNVTITLNSQSQSIEIGKNYNLTATVKHGTDVLNRFINWESSNPSIATVDGNGLVTGLSIGTTTITATCFGKTATCEITVIPPTPVYVDLGLSVHWASFNIGAYKPEDFGDYYSWAEIETKDEYSWESYKWGLGYYPSFTKYNNDKSFGDYIDNNKEIDEVDDVAHVKLGGNWYMPTIEQINELIENCTCTWTNQNGVNGYKITGKNGNSIFLPAAGQMEASGPNAVGIYGFYWAANLSRYPNGGSNITFRSEGNTKEFIIGSSNRYTGCSVRPVYLPESYLDLCSISLNNNSKTIIVEKSYNLSATVKYGNTTLEKEVSWSSSDPSIATVSETGVVTGVAVGTANITATCYGIISTCVVTIVEPTPEYVDLGLSVNWATFNVGARAPEEYGKYYAWGEVATKDNYLWSTYKWGSTSSFTKYNYSNENGNVDNKMVLDLEDDVAHILWGGDWRMPLKEEFLELYNNCTRTWVTINGVSGFKFTSKIEGYTSRYIFLPASGFHSGNNKAYIGTDGYYWSSSLHTSEPYSGYILYFSSNGVTAGAGDRRFGGFSVRPVSPSVTWLDNLSITLNNDTLSIQPGETNTLIATVKENNHIVNDFPLIWSSQNPLIATVSENGVVTGVNNGSTIISATCCGKTVSCGVSVDYDENGYEYVDLGLSVKWATYNIGATVPEGYGTYIQWGALDGNYYYNTWESYKFRKSGTTNEDVKFNKYNNSSSYGTIDNKEILDYEDDVAQKIWGGTWRLPTPGEFEELCENCTWLWTTLNGVNGYIVTSNKENYTDRSIFLPAAGHYDDNVCIGRGSIGFYWSNTLYTSSPFNARLLGITSGVQNPHTYRTRKSGCSVRPVCP